MRIVITGSRGWDDVLAIRERLLPLLLEHPDAVLVHGAAPGADTIAALGWEHRGGKTEAHPLRRADWDAPCDVYCDHGPRRDRGDGTTYCPAVGGKRNQRMMDAGADLCIAFRKPGKSNGTDDAIKRAHAAGIPVDVVLPNEHARLF